jgi:hypothetical protein
MKRVLEPVADAMTTPRSNMKRPRASACCVMPRQFNAALFHVTALLALRPCWF